MSLPHSNFTTLASFTLPANTASAVEIDTSAWSELQLYVAYTYAKSSSGVGLFGLAASSTDGAGFQSPTGSNVYVGGGNPSTPTYDSVGSILTPNPVLPSNNASQTVYWKINVPVSTIGEWYKLTLKNQDTVNSVAIQLFADAS